MGKKSFIHLAIIVLAILITAGSYFIEIIPPGQLDASTSYRGLLFGYWSQIHLTYDYVRFPLFPPKLDWSMLIIDLFLWFIILEAVWLIFSVIKKR